jgi:hypothetical protein
VLFLREKKGKARKNPKIVVVVLLMLLLLPVCIYVLGLDVMVRHVKQLVNLSYNGVGK